MKYTKAQIIWGSAASDKLMFNLANISYTDPYVVKSISGLEPPEVTLSIADKLFEGGMFQGRRPVNREIVMLISFQPNYSIGEDAGILRKRLYGILTPKLGGNITFRLWDDAETEYVQTTGHIKRIENNIFSKDPEVQITMSCLSAYFSEPQYTYPSPATLSAKATIPITNNGDVSIGFAFTQTLTAAMGSYTLTGASSSQFIKLTYAFLANDRLIINTNPGARSVKRIRSGVADLNLLPQMSSDSSWVMLDPGLNNLKSSTTAFTAESFIYTEKHWGF